MKLRVGFSTTNALHSRIIRWFTEGRASHTYIRFYDEFLGADLIMHADWPGVLIEDAELFEAQNTIIEEFEFEDLRFKASLKKNLRLLRKKYDYWNIADWAWIITFKRWAKIKIKNPIEDPKKIICVDFVIRILNPVIDLALGGFHPKSLNDWMNQHYEEYHGTKHSRNY